MKLAKFTVCGFRNFKNPVTLDFTAVHDYKFSTECVDDGIITKFGIYGVNGSGKSNLGIALFNIVPLLTDKFIDPEITNNGNFLNLDKKTSSASFSYEFVNGKDNYKFEYFKAADNSLLKEKLIVNDIVIYDYDYLKNDFSTLNTKDLINENLNFTYLNGKLSVLRYIANNSALKNDSPIKSIMDFVSHMLWFRSIRQNAFIGFDNSITLIEDWIIRNGLIKDYNDFLINICGLDVKLSTATLPDNRQIIIENHDNGKLIFNQSYSSGTSAAELFFFWMKKFNEVSLLFMDEFDAYYHFELSLKIIEILKTYTKMQAVFTTHNTSLMGNEILRPDCYLIMKKGILKPYIDLVGGKEIREGHNLEKIYRGGGLDV